MAIGRILKSKENNHYEDCVELLKHTGRVRLEELPVIKFTYDLFDLTIPIDDVIPDNLDKSTAQSMLSRCIAHFDVSGVVLKLFIVVS